MEFPSYTISLDQLRRGPAAGAKAKTMTGTSRDPKSFLPKLPKYLAKERARVPTPDYSAPLRDTILVAELEY